MLSLKMLSMALILGVSALIFAMHGQGGGVLYTPLQVLFGAEFHTAATRSHLFMVITALSSTFVFGRARLIDWPLAMVLELAAGSGAFLGGLYSNRFAPVVLMVTLGVVVFLAGVSMLKDFRSARPSAKYDSSMWRWHRDVGGKRYEANLAAGLPLWFGIGVIGGLTGVAGGFLKVPLMVLVFGMPIEIAFGCASLMVMLTAGSGLAGHLTASSLDWATTLPLGAVVAVGSQIGPRLTLRSDPSRLQHRFAYLLFALAAVILYLSWRS